MRLGVGLIALGLVVAACGEPMPIASVPPGDDALLYVWVAVDEAGATRRGVSEPRSRIELSGSETLSMAVLTATSLTSKLDWDRDHLADSTQVECNLACTRSRDDSVEGGTSTPVESIAVGIYTFDAESKIFAPSTEVERARFACLRVPRRPEGCRPGLPEPRWFQPFGRILADTGPLPGGYPSENLVGVARLDEDHLLAANREGRLYWIERGVRWTDEPRNRLALEEQGLDVTQFVIFAPEPTARPDGRRHVIVFATDPAVEESASGVELEPSSALEVIVGRAGFEEVRALDVPRGAIRDVAWIPSRSEFVAVGHEGAVWTSSSAGGRWVDQTTRVDDLRRVHPTDSPQWPIVIGTLGGGVWAGDLGRFESFGVFTFATTVTALAARPSDDGLEIWVGSRSGNMARLRLPEGEAETLNPGFVGSGCGATTDACGWSTFAGRINALDWLPDHGGHFIGSSGDCVAGFSIRPEDQCAAPWASSELGLKGAADLWIDDEWITGVGGSGTLIEARRRAP